MKEIFKIIGILSGISVSLLFIVVLRIDYLTNLLRKNIKTGDKVRFYIGEEGQRGTVETVYYKSGVKMAKIHGRDGFTEVPISEIYI